MNLGAYRYITPRLRTAMKAMGRGLKRSIKDIKYVGRPPSAGTATGFLSVHLQEQEDLIQNALLPEPVNYPH
ncbi:putative 2-oxoglutarate dehydrogenase E1 component [Dioscorea sansibarensis]